MKVVVLTTRHRPDDDRVFFKEAVSLRTAYPDVTIAAPAPGDAADFLGSGIRLVGLPGGRRGLGRLRRLAGAVRAVRSLRPDVCHVHDLELVPLIPLFIRLARCAVVYDVHEAYPEGMLITPRLPALARRPVAGAVDAIEKRVARRCQVIITADAACTETFSGLGVPVTTVFNFPRLSLFDARAEDIAAARSVLGDGEVLLYQGSMARVRGLFHMIEALPLVLRAQPTARLGLVGLADGPLREAATSLARELGVFGRITMLPLLPHREVAPFVHAATLGLVPLQPVKKFHMNLPIKLFEYMACGLPFVSSDTDSIRPFVVESGAGILYDATSAQGLAEAVIRLLDAPEQRKSMGAKGRAAVEEKWNWGMMEKELLGAYSRIEGARRSSWS